MAKIDCAPAIWSDSRMWALGHFGDADLGDRRRSKDSYN
jgi:hypothetical protein